MISLIMDLLRWCLKYWRNILTWLGISAVATWGIFEAFEGLKTVASWAFGHWASVFDYAVNSMDDVATAIDQYSYSVGGWIAGILDILEIRYFVVRLVGWAAFVVLVVEWTVAGLVISIIGFAVVLIYFKLKLKGISTMSK